MSTVDAPPILWQPTPEQVEQSNLTAFTRWLEARLDRSFGAYDELWQWSVDDVEGFWAAIWDFFGVEREHGRVLADPSMPGARWFPEAQVNYARHLFAGKPDERVAILHATEARPLAELTWGELRELTGRVRAGLMRLGVGRGDRVVAYVPNVPEAMASFLATASLGAVWSSCSPDFGVRSVVDRFAQIEPAVLIAVDGYTYGGRDHDRRAVVAELMESMPSLRATVLLPLLDPAAALAGTVAWEELVAEPAELAFESVPFDHPLWILYSSGTTGLPKAIVQGHGGILLEHLKELTLHVDLRPGDRLFWFTTTGWMMWNFLLSGLLTEAAIVLYDGNPGTPDLGVLWDLAERTGVTCFGTSASYLASCMKGGIEPAEGRDLSRLRAVGSTGSPLSPEGFRWVYDHLGEHVWLFSTSGGTDVCTAFVGGVPTLPVYEGELQGPALGAALAAWDEDGRPLVDEVGELVLTEPMPSMPVGFWGDEDGSRYRDAYFSMYEGVWRHGDWIRITPRGTAVIYGRSDSTINRGGIRMGTAEIYRAVLADDAVVDALVVDLPRPGAENWMPLFVVLRPGEQLTDELAARLRSRVREDCSPRHVPNEVVAIAEVPRTLSGKVLEVPVKRILTGTPPERAAARDSLANPAALDPFVAMAGRFAAGEPLAA